MDKDSHNPDVIALADENLSMEELERELKAHKELQEFAASLKIRKEKHDTHDPTEVIIDNKLLIDKIDLILGNNPTGDDESYQDLKSARNIFLEESNNFMRESMILNS